MRQARQYNRFYHDGEQEFRATHLNDEEIQRIDDKE